MDGRQKMNRQAEGQTVRPMDRTEKRTAKDRKAGVGVDAVSCENLYYHTVFSDDILKQVYLI